MQFVNAAAATGVWVLLNISVFVGFDIHPGGAAFSLLGLYIYCSFMLWMTVFSSAVRPLELVFWLFHTNFMLLPAFAQVANRQFFWGSFGDYTGDAFILACVLVLVGLLATRIGGLFAAGQRVTRTEPTVMNRRPPAQLEVSGLSALFLIAAMVSLVGFVLVLGVEFFTSSRTEKVGQVESLVQLGMLLTLPRALAFGTLLFLSAVCMNEFRQKRIPGPGVLALLLISIAVNGVVNFPLSLSRFWFFGFLISLVWVVFPLRSRLLRSLFIIGMTLLQFTLFPWYSEITRGTGYIGLDVDSIREYVKFGDFDGYQTILNVIYYIDGVGLQMGYNLLSAFLFFVPRGVWSNKAEPLGVASAEYIGYPFTNLSAPIYGELYADFGFASLILGMMLVGYLLKRFDGLYDYDLRRGRLGAGFLFTSVLAGYLIILLRGSLLGVIPGIATLLVVLAGLVVLGRIRVFRSLSFRRPDNGPVRGPADLADHGKQLRD